MIEDDLGHGAGTATAVPPCSADRYPASTTDSAQRPRETDQRGPAIAATAADPERLRKSRRENPVMATLPLI